MKKKKRACLIWHRKSGKSMTLLNFTIQKAFERVGNYYHCFPYYSEGKKVIWDGKDNEGHPFLDYFIPEEIRKKTNNTEMKIELINGSIYQIIGADNYDSVMGANPVGLIFDEWAVSNSYPMARDYFMPIIVSNGGWIVYVYTPRGRNHGYATYQMALRNPDWFCQLLTNDDTQAVSRQDIEAERAEGRPEDMLQQEFYCSFLASTSDILIPPDLLEAAINRVLPMPWGPRLAGCDCARFGDDRSTLVIRQGQQVIHAESWQKLDNVQLAGKIIERYRSKFFDAVAIDVIGMPGVYDMVRNAGIPCVGVNVAENSPRNPERYWRLRDELWWSLREFFNDRACCISRSIPDNARKALIADIQDIHYSYKGLSGKIIIEPKSDMKKRLGFSPDLGDALCNTFAPGLTMKTSESERVPFGYVNPGTVKDDYNPLTFNVGR